MKKLIFFLAIVLLAVGAYFGYQRVAINVALKMVQAECSPTDSDPDKAWIKERACQIIEEENRQLREVAASSKTYKEFENKAGALIEQWEKENKLGQLLEQFKLRSQRRK